MIVESYEDVIKLSGALRSNFWETIHTAISLLLKRHPTGVIIDCGGITECTPGGADTFRDAMEFIERFDARIIMASVPPQVLEVLRSVPEVRSQLPIVATVEEARRSLDLLWVDPEGGKKKSVLASSRKLLICMSGHTSDEHLLTITAEMAAVLKADVHVMFPIIVPRDLPLQAPLHEQEQKALKAFDMANQVLSAEHVSHTPRLERARDVGTAIFEVAEEVNATQVIVALSSAVDIHDEMSKLVKSVMAKVKQPLHFVRGPSN